MAFGRSGKASSTVGAATSRQNRQAETDGANTPEERQVSVSQQIHSKAYRDGRWAGEANDDPNDTPA